LRVVGVVAAATAAMIFSSLPVVVLAAALWAALAEEAALACLAQHWVFAATVLSNTLAPSPVGVVARRAAAARVAPAVARRAREA
jgi:hypothetical protein